MRWLKIGTILFFVIYGILSAIYHPPDYIFAILFIVWLIIALRFSGGLDTSGDDYSRIEKWIKVNYGFDVKDKAKTGRLYELDSVYSHELGKRIPEKRLRGLQAYIRTQKNKRMIR